MVGACGAHRDDAALLLADQVKRGRQSRSACWFRLVTRDVYIHVVYVRYEIGL